MAANNAKTGKKVIRRRREKKNVERGQVHIRSSFNNTMVTVTDTRGQATPFLGFSGGPSASAAARSPLFAAQSAAEICRYRCDGVTVSGLVEVFVKRAPARVVKLRSAPCRLSAWRSR